MNTQSSHDIALSVALAAAVAAAERAISARVTSNGAMRSSPISVMGKKAAAQGWQGLAQRAKGAGRLDG